MFWGLLLEPGKRYSTTVEKSFHVSKGVLDCSSVKNDSEILSVILETEGSESLLCNLCKQRGILQESLDLNFMAGDRLTFECRGNGKVHLSGYLLPDDDDDITSNIGDEESEEEEDMSWNDSSPGNQKKNKRKSDVQPGSSQQKKKKVPADDNDDDDDEEEGDSDDENESDALEDEDEDMEDEEEGDDDEEEEGSDDDEDSAEEKLKQKKTPNKQPTLTPSKKTPVTNGLTPKDKSNKRSSDGEVSKSTPKPKQVLEGGVIVKDIIVGNGPLAKPGKFVEVFYVGKLKSNGKVFDKRTKGEAFKFKLGKGDVIKGWDIGVQGMKVGGKRTIHCPPNVGYGMKGAPPKIPPNSTLIFDVELRNIH